MPPPPSVALPLDDFLIVPKVRVGPFHAQTTARELRRLFPAAQVVDRNLDGPEGMPLVGTVLFPRTVNQIEIIWTDQSRRQIDSVRLEQAHARWRLAPTGLQVGMPLGELVRRNAGHPISFAGFDWDYGGIVSDYGGGPLARLQDTCQLVIGYPAELQSRLSRQLAAFSGDGVKVVSTNPALRPLHLFVQQITVDL